MHTQAKRSCTSEFGGLWTQHALKHNYDKYGQFFYRLSFIEEEEKKQVSPIKEYDNQPTN